MHISELYGHLYAAGRPLDAKDLSKLIGESERDITKWLTELVRNSVCSINEEGVIFSRRMVKDEALREVRAAGGEAGKSFGKLGAEHGSKGGRPRKTTGDKKPPLEPPPSSSSSSSSSKPTSQPDTGASNPEKFPMRIGWHPSAHVDEQARQALVKITPQLQQEFIAHWLTQPDRMRSQAEWDKALLQSALHQKAAGPPKSREGPKPENFDQRDYGQGVQSL